MMILSWSLRAVCLSEQQRLTWYCLTQGSSCHAVEKLYCSLINLLFSPTITLHLTPSCRSCYSLISSMSTIRAAHIVHQHYTNATVCLNVSPDSPQYAAYAARCCVLSQSISASITSPVSKSTPWHLRKSERETERVSDMR